MAIVSRSKTTNVVKDSQRIVGYDVARALAILAMVIVHFALTFVNIEQPTTNGLLSLIVQFCEGRAAALFVVLAGVGLSLIARTQANPSSEAIQAKRWTLTKRGLFLLGLGLLNLTIWPGDILRVYGVSFLLIAWLFQSSNRRILGLALGFMLAFVGLMLRFNFNQNWDWTTLEYTNLWTIKGGLRNLFFDGFRSVFPWTSLIFFGIWLGRQNVQAAHVRWRLFWIGLSVALGVQIGSIGLTYVFSNVWPILGQADAELLFSTGSIPPMPLFLLSAGGVALAIIMSCVQLSQLFGASRIIHGLAATGQLALTWYIGHVVIGLGVLTSLGFYQNQSLATSLWLALGFFGLAVGCSVWWKKRFNNGPLETVLRWATS
ncbi:MAG TPA: DUF418 domain-containing protein [Herpetosiphon sp.]|uniref:Conserved hypothetical membrane spanning protein n=1 Tax=Herpetosiphon aurantiacus (strain ATCC 23779 / DSM 785 / 114-95) TaxID=316274 RepID=A9B4B2_HERA2|nr:DUF418 domain-containing protein [Herpetosiphon sp.]ABX02669.1 conserved hypothetical membrane spanning protein [Herpetosiphon aurantiacus DSM 785]HBW49577.1 DUF418 domain-containing protein [Herpetosiphon sp.]